MKRDIHFEIQEIDGKTVVKVYQGEILLGNLDPYNPLDDVASLLKKDLLLLFHDIKVETSDIDFYIKEILKGFDFRGGNVGILGNEGIIIVLPHIALIERPDLAGKTVRVSALVASTSIAYLAPASIYLGYTDDTGEELYETIEIEKTSIDNLRFIGVSDDTLRRRLTKYIKSFLWDPRMKIIDYTINQYRTIYRVRCRHPVQALYKTENKIIDERGFEYKSYDIYNKRKGTKFRAKCSTHIRRSRSP